MNAFFTFLFFALAFVCFVWVAFRNGIGRAQTDFLALGLAFWMLVLTWNAAATQW